MKHTFMFVVMKSTILQFNSISDLASYAKTVNPNGYRMNTADLTLSAHLSSLELALAIEQYKAAVVQEKPAATENLAAWLLFCSRFERN
jgi:hypothetical protein